MANHKQAMSYLQWTKYEQIFQQFLIPKQPSNSISPATNIGTTQRNWSMHSWCYASGPHYPHQWPQAPYIQVLGMQIDLLDT